MVNLLKLQLRPGINRETTDYGNSGGYYDCNLVRFRNGQPESIGGWTRFTSEVAAGTWRSLFPFSLLDGNRYYAGGTNLKYYIVRGNGLVDITPIRATSTINNNPFATAIGTTTVTVTDTAHGAVINDFVTFSGSSGTIGGVPVGEFNAEHQITSIIDANSYTISVTTTATSSVSGGGASVSAAYQINTGLDTTVLGNGYGTGGYGVFGYGLGSTSSVVTGSLRLWSQDNFGEDIIFNVRDGGIYYKDMSLNVTTRAVNLTSLAGASGVPIVAKQVLVSNNDRHAVAFGCNPVDSVVQDRLLARWAETENLALWTPDTTNTAGSIRFDSGSEFVTAVEATNEILVFTDVALHSFKFIGPPYTFGQTLIGTNISLIGPNAVVSSRSVVYWMETGVRFRVYDGTIHDLPCDVRTYVASILNMSQTQKIVAGANRQFTEVYFHLPVDGEDEVNFYLVCNLEGATPVWYYGYFGSQGRTTWLDAFFENTPLAGAPDGYIYAHDTGAVDGSVMPSIKLEDYLESSVYEIGQGDDFMFISRYIPDFDFTNSSAANPGLTVTLTKRDYPGSPFETGVVTGITRSVAMPVEQYTAKNDIRLRARSVQYRVESSVLGTAWAQGVPRVYLDKDGKR